jgi:predicted 3-demethylubiquinone-9 3-methyltransferase (glyoxalase superfamily)
LWQVVPTILGKLIADKDPEKSKGVVNAMLQMKKMEIAKLEVAARG